MQSDDTKIKGQLKRNEGAARDFYLHNWEGLRAFLDVARARSISQAAALLDLQHTTLSRRIDALERDIGRTLLIRSARGIRLTPDGMELLSVLERFDEDLSAAGRWITRGVKGGERPIQVSIACTEGLAAYWLTLFLPSMRRNNIQACYNIHTGLAPTPEKGKSFHASVQMFQPGSSETAQQVGHVHFAAMATQSYIDEVGRYKPGDDPRAHRWIEYAPFRVMSGSWEHWFQQNRIDVQPYTVTNSLVTTVNAVRAGAGIGLLPTYMPIVMPELVTLEAGLKLKFPIWLSKDSRSQDRPELSAAMGLIGTAINPATMPWFHDEPEPRPDIVEWRKLLNQAISRMD